MIDDRQPSLEEAVAHVMRSLSREYRRSCLDYWTERYGAEYAECVRRETTKRWDEKGRKRREHTQTSVDR